MNNNLQTLLVAGAGTFVSLYVLENFLHIPIAHHAAKKAAAAPKAAKGGGKAAAGGGAAAAAPADTGGAAATGNTWQQNPASKTPCGQIGQSCPTVGAKDPTTWCICQGGAAAPAAAATSGFTCDTCTAGTTPGSFTCTNCSGAGAPASITATPAAAPTTPAASAANVAYAYSAWAIAR